MNRRDRSGTESGLLHIGKNAAELLHMLQIYVQVLLKKEMIWCRCDFSLANKIGDCILNRNVQFKTSSKNM
jgi:hypothetical protein